MSSPLSQIVRAKLDKLVRAKESIVVLKGIPLNIVDENAVENIAAAVDNPLQYFISNVNRKFLTYEEFLLTYSFVLNQYSEVFVLTNNLYLAQFPIEASFSDDMRKNLLEHFAEPEVGQGREFNLGRLAEIFTGVKEHGGIMIGVYNDDKVRDELKIRTVNLFERSAAELDTVESSGAFDLDSESEFVLLVRKIIFDAPDRIYVRLNNYSGNRNELEHHVRMLQENFPAQIYLASQPKPAQIFKSNAEYKKILKELWNYDNFREFDVYDLENLDVERGRKPTIKISQEQIISDIVQQVEACINGDDSRDIFVTAATGFGKSLIFQLPAIYLARKYGLFTIVISPLIGLMEDQVEILRKIYPHVATINSTTPPVIRSELTRDIAAGKIHILYISPETLLSRSTLEQLIGNRAVGMAVIDEAHIVTTWGKQFRPDYWYLGDHIKKLRRTQINRHGHSFVIATFTATMIYRGLDKMYEETLESLNMPNPITYLGYLKRDDIEIIIDKTPAAKNQRSRYEIDKFDDLDAAVNRAVLMNRKTLIYFPEVRLVEKAYALIQNKIFSPNVPAHKKSALRTVTIYHGQLDKDAKKINHMKFRSGESLVMFATKAFGMGIDINDIAIVMHFAPTGNVCDYVQEIGRAARNKNLRGEARYHYINNDFKYINRLHGLSTVKKYQLIAVVEKLCEIYRQSGDRNNLLLDAENFTYIFDRYGDEDTSVNKVKTALLIIQRDFEARLGFTPITVRPVPLFEYGYFEIPTETQENLIGAYGECVRIINRERNICRVNLNTIWRRGFQDKSFPQFKYLLYADSKQLNFPYVLRPALCVSMEFLKEYASIYESGIFSEFRKIILGHINAGALSVDDIVDILQGALEISKYKIQTVGEVLVASMTAYMRNFSGNNAIYIPRFTGGRIRYSFKLAVNRYFDWVDDIFKKIIRKAKGGQLYLTDISGRSAKEYSIVLGILEALGVLNFEMSGGEGSQLYIHINQIGNLQNILDNRSRYNNRILESVAERHTASVKVLTYLYESNFTSDEIWNLLEDYFLGKILEV